MVVVSLVRGTYPGEWTVVVSSLVTVVGSGFTTLVVQEGRAEASGMRSSSSFFMFGMAGFKGEIGRAHV